MMQDTSTRLGSENTGPSSSAVPEPGQIQLLVLDLDGTAVGESNQIRPGVKQAIQAVQAKGVQVAIATGRMYQAALRFHQDLNSTLPLMAYQGALIKDPATEQIYRDWTIPRHYALRLLDDLEQPELRDLFSVHCYISDRLYIRELTPESQLYAKRSQIEPIVAGDLRRLLTDESTPEPTKILALAQQPELIDRLLTSLRQQYSPAELYFTTSVATFFEVTNPLVNKGTAVRYLAEEVLGLQAANVMTIGDNFNDLEMIEYAGIGVAMGNAPAAVRAAAQWVAPDVESDGVAAAIEQFVL